MNSVADYIRRPCSSVARADDPWLGSDACTYKNVPPNVGIAIYITGIGFPGVVRLKAITHTQLHCVLSQRGEIVQYYAMPLSYVSSNQQYIIFSN